MQIRHILVITIALLTAFAADAAPQNKKKSLSKSSPKELMEQAAKDFAAYRFDAALEAIANLNTPEARDLHRRAELGTNMLGRVEQVAIIDSVTLPRAGLMALLPLSKESGTLFTPTRAMLGQACIDGSGAFVSADGRSFIWSMPGPYGTSYLVSSHRLVDGSFEPPEDLGEDLHVGRYVGYPYLMPDGITLYFAADGDASLGGLDIFMSRSNGSDFLQPQNLGMPYNSPYDDYMMAIDESTGYGFWVTDRNQIPDSVTLYMFRVNDLRRNYPADEANLADHARITSVAATPGARDPQFMKAYSKPTHNGNHGIQNADDLGYAIAVPGKGVITSSAQIQTQIGIVALNRYVGLRQYYDNILEELVRLRVAYASGDKSVGFRILSLEHELLAIEKHLADASNALIRAESNTTDR